MNAERTWSARVASSPSSCKSEPKRMAKESESKSEIVLYQTEDGETRIECRFVGETVSLSLNQMAELFQRDKSVISKHIKNIFDEGELQPAATVAKFATVQTEGGRTVSREIDSYNLDSQAKEETENINRHATPLLAG